jgi:hypothetical protein
VKYAWIDSHRNEWSLAEMCETLPVSISGYRAWKRGGSPVRKRLTDIQLLTLIKAIHAEFKKVYGSPRILKELRHRGIPASKARVERLMRENGVTGSVLKRRRTRDTRYRSRRTCWGKTSMLPRPIRSGSPI